MRYLLLILFLACPALGKAANRDSVLIADSPVFSTNVVNPLPNYKSTKYWKRHRILKGCAWTTLSVGGGGMLVGLFGDIVNELDTDSDSKGDKALWKGVFYSGLCLAVSSIPLFVFSHKNKKKALSVVVSGQALSSPFPNGTAERRPALSVAIRF
ncbi:MAG: hypothetical protein LBN29_02270 [Mediterranea sp.]|jgi:hypothetical protein|nr:hypothetical protein [Mediterranea sp.]